ncbi:hypothetical protein Glove_423g53 [Diversispora epigaea]|uniref:Uncharacterized protein n=1 Tax=Diversispora epigaea TaxID=1348612 RepID=A0A397GUS6_9GLOM|nr:hypothetical protein Glove_423g53 [Diversispora epigaea]
MRSRKFLKDPVSRESQEKIIPKCALIDGIIDIQLVKNISPAKMILYLQSIIISEPYEECKWDEFENKEFSNKKFSLCEFQFHNNEINNKLQRRGKMVTSPNLLLK